MLLPASEFRNLKLRAKDGDIGHAREFYFDDRFWTVRYLVVDTGGWLGSRQVLVSPYALGAANLAERVLPVDLTKERIEQRPPLESHEPVSRQYEIQYYDYYNWPYHGSGPYVWGITRPSCETARTGRATGRRRPGARMPGIHTSEAPPTCQATVSKP